MKIVVFLFPEAKGKNIIMLFPIKLISLQKALQFLQLTQNKPLMQRVYKYMYKDTKCIGVYHIHRKSSKKFAYLNKFGGFLSDITKNTGINSYYI